MNKSLKSYAASAALALSLATPASALDQFLELSNEIDGSSQDANFKGAIDVLAWSWGLSNSSTFGGGGGAGKANFQDISITKYLDQASPKLYTRVAKGDFIDKGTLSVRSLIGGKSIVTTKIELEKIFVTSASTGGSGGEDILTENITLNFAKFTLENTEIKSDGTEGATTSFCYDIEMNKPC